MTRRTSRRRTSLQPNSSRHYEYRVYTYRTGLGGKSTREPGWSFADAKKFAAHAVNTGWTGAHIIRALRCSDGHLGKLSYVMTVDKKETGEELLKPNRRTSRKRTSLRRNSSRRYQRLAKNVRVRASKWGMASEATITKKVFKGAGVNQFRGLTDVFSHEEIKYIAGNPFAGKWRNIAMDLLDGDTYGL